MLFDWFAFLGGGLFCLSVGFCSFFSFGRVVSLCGSRVGFLWFWFFGQRCLFCCLCVYVLGVFSPHTFLFQIACI